MAEESTPIEVNQSTKRGWIFDELMKIGHLEAKLTHQDENICNLYHDMDENSGDKEEIERLVEDLSARHEVERLTYGNRAMSLDHLFSSVPNSNRHWFCDVKHDAAAFVLAAETYHASGFDPDLERSLVYCGKTLAISCSKAFNMEVMDCLRCVNDALNAQLGFDQNEIATEVIAVAPEPTSEPGPEQPQKPTHRSMPDGSDNSYEHTLVTWR